MRGREGGRVGRKMHMKEMAECTVVVVCLGINENACFTDS